ncbi:PcfJ domain-containing protein [Ruminococcus albus]|uniref:PcfJ-like protein n=1 Tax=Ruminococcus albus TaxID=1264 RepID=A0A1I1R8W9_RUMAL|nr:PcfJ domain-containing protein [Ruminococcus albus]SFD26770.1 hypothetical protein SAMN02910406_03543 [Ruminococcus albus]
MKNDIPLSLLRDNITEEEIAEYFTTEDFPCKSISDIRLMRSLKEKGAPYLFKYISELHNKYCLDNQYYNFKLMEFADSVIKVTDALKDGEAEDFLHEMFDEIRSENDLDSCIKERRYYELAKYYVEERLPFNLTSTNALPDDIIQFAESGYDMTVYYKGISRTVHTEPKGIFINYVPYYGVTIKNGRIITKNESRKEKIIIFYYNTATFVEGRKKRDGSFIYTPLYLRDLFEAISIGHSEEDISSAKSVIDYLCDRYDTKLFVDLYRDYQLSNGLLLPLTLDEVGQYRTKQELFENHYKMPLKGNWNKKNVNLTYLLLKLKCRLSDAAIARTMQCVTPPRVTHVGRSRYKYTFILHNAIYSEDYAKYNNNISLLEDALKEEYEAKKIELLPINQTINAHNDRHRRNEIKKQIKKATVKVKKDTKFRTLIDNLPKNYELISNEKRLCEEAESQKNCVYSYAKDITSDRCMIYSTVYDGKRHTIEIVKYGSKYVVRQCFRACNQTPSSKLVKQLKNDVAAVNDVLNTVIYRKSEELPK